MKPLLLALLLAAACKHSTSSSSETHSEATSTTETRTEESGTQTTTTVVTEAPGTTTTTVSEYAPPGPEPAEAPDGGTAPPQKQLRHGPLVRRTVTVESRGQETTQTVQQAKTEGATASEVKAAGKTDAKGQEAESSKPALSCAFGGWLVVLVVGVAILGLIYGALKIRKVI